MGMKNPAASIAVQGWRSMYNQSLVTYRASQPTYLLNDRALASMLRYAITSPHPTVLDSLLPEQPPYGAEAEVVWVKKGDAYIMILEYNVLARIRGMPSLRGGTKIRLTRPGQTRKFTSATRRAAPWYDRTRVDVMKMRTPGGAHEISPVILLTRALFAFERIDAKQGVDDPASCP